MNSCLFSICSTLKVHQIRVLLEKSLVEFTQGASTATVLLDVTDQTLTEVSFPKWLLVLLKWVCTTSTSIAWDAQDYSRQPAFRRRSGTYPKCFYIRYQEPLWLDVINHGISSTLSRWRQGEVSTSWGFPNDLGLYGVDCLGLRLLCPGGERRFHSSHYIIRVSVEFLGLLKTFTLRVGVSMTLRSRC